MTFYKNTTQNQCFLMKNLKNTSFLITFGGASGFPRWKNTCFFKSDRHIFVQNDDFWQKQHTKSMLFNEKSYKHIVFDNFWRCIWFRRVPRWENTCFLCGVLHRFSCSCFFCRGLFFAQMHDLGVLPQALCFGSKGVLGNKWQSAGRYRSRYRYRYIYIYVCIYRTHIYRYVAQREIHQLCRESRK